MKWTRPTFSLAGVTRIFKKFFLIMDGGKEVIRKTRLFVLIFTIIASGAGVVLLTSGNVNTSFLKKSEHSLSNNEMKAANKVNQAPGKVGKMLQNSEGRAQ